MTLTLAPLPPSRPLERPWSREHVHAPAGDNAFVAQPALTTAASLARSNRERLDEARVELLGKSLPDLRRWARQEVWQAARRYTNRFVPGYESLSDLPADLETTSFFVGGHQPTLFHPGVWVKNFVVSGLARQDRGVGLNLVVDTDTMGGTAIRVPAGPRETPAVCTIPFDDPRARQPWEEVRIVNRALFESFPERVQEAFGDHGYRPLVADFWPAAVACSQRSTSLAECLTAARCTWEHAWQSGNLELPVSQLCELEPFLWFAAHILAHLPRFVATYNEVLREYRTVNRVRSRTHPVPDLRDTGGWLEAPFRIWYAGDEVRRRVFAREQGGRVELSDGQDVFATLPLSADGDATGAVHELQQLAQRGIRFRTRALTTTMFARLCFADLFVHGIGGAKYDQMTDRIIARFFGLAAPEFLTLSATLRLDVPAQTAHVADEQRLVQQLRELDFNSDRYLSAPAARDHADLIAEKQRLIAEQQVRRVAERGTGTPPENTAATPGRTAGYARFRRLQEVNRQLAGLTRSERLRIEEELRMTRSHLAANSIWQDREYSFCLFSTVQLHRFMDYVCASFGK